MVKLFLSEDSIKNLRFLSIWVCGIVAPDDGEQDAGLV